MDDIYLDYVGETQEYEIHVVYPISGDLIVWKTKIEKDAKLFEAELRYKVELAKIIEKSK